MAGSGGGPTVAKAYVAIIPTTKDAQKNISKGLVPQMESAADEAGEAGGQSLVGKLGSVLKSGAAKIAGIAAAAGVAAIGASIVKGFSDFEQLSGGIETIFGEKAAATVMKNANRAFSSVQMSANQYMETATSFSASLIQSLGGDTEAAAKLADTAISDMADNANKMGSDISSIQTAYQGFAKQNYSMLDNLKLGYGGTQQEMYRLLTDAAKLNSEFAQTAEFSIDDKGHLTAGFADIARAIHIVQENMGIAGASAEEAASTLEGSTNMMKASWENLLTAFGRGNAGAIEPALAAMLDSIEAWGRNIIPRVGIILMGIVREVPYIIEQLASAVPDWLSEIGAAIQANLPDMLNAIANVLGIDIESTLQAPVVQSVLALGERVSEAFSQVFGDIDLSQTLADIQTGLSALGDFVTWVFDSASIEISKFLDSIDTASLAQGFETLKAVGAGLMSILKSVGEIAITIFQKILLPVLSHLWELWTNTIWPGLQDIFTLLQPILMTIGDMLITAFDWLSKIAAIIGEVLGPVIDALFAWLGPKISQLIDNIKFVLTLLAEDFKVTWAIVKPIVDIFIKTMLSAFGAFGTEIKKVQTAFTIVFNAIRSIVSNVVSSIIGTVSGIAGNIAGAFWNAVSGISAAFSNVYSIITSPFREAFNAIRRLWNNTIGGFSFSVPSWIPGVGGRSFRIPRLATGGDITTAGTVMVGEAGPELLSLPRGARVTPLSDAAPQGATYSVVVGDVDLSDDDQVRRVTREYLEFLARLAAPTSMVTA